jgi:hypothetical protein
MELFPGKLQTSAVFHRRVLLSLWLLTVLFKQTDVTVNPAALMQLNIA